MHGHDLTPILQDPSREWLHPVLCEHFGKRFGQRTWHGRTGDESIHRVPWWISLCQGRYKYIRTLLDDEIEKLYDLQGDPEELVNLALDPEYREILADYRGRLIDELHRSDGSELAGNLPIPTTMD